ncbi:MAG: hypothetical protein KDE33_13910 [Bacteroidetes bacterium]|nr:hypothetical protein [Bacteroidota bacterium]
MSEAEKLLEKFARKNMIQWNQESFKRSHSRLHKSIIEAINEALRIHDVVGRSEQLKCQCKNAQFTRTVDADFNPLCGRCGKAL